VRLLDALAACVVGFARLEVTFELDLLGCKILGQGLLVRNMSDRALVGFFPPVARGLTTSGCFCFLVEGPGDKLEDFLCPLLALVLLLGNKGVSSGSDNPPEAMVTGSACADQGKVV
jgi:hypothetical protein